MKFYRLLKKRRLETTKKYTTAFSFYKILSVKVNGKLLKSIYFILFKFEDFYINFELQLVLLLFLILISQLKFLNVGPIFNLNNNVSLKFIKMLLLHFGTNKTMNRNVSFKFETLISSICDISVSSRRNNYKSFDSAITIIIINSFCSSSYYF